jgi:glucose-6-phosphate 1-dehydrogenase
MIQNINTLRFSNQLFSAVWDNRSIDNVQISVKEDALVKERAGYYDQSGALRDMVQNHLLQILAFVAMEPPVLCDPNSIRTEKVNVFKNIKINKEEVVFGQYEGYRQEDKVDENSTTDTFVALKCQVDTKRWKGVPFYLRTGKALNSREAEIIIELKKESSCEQFEENIEPNLLVIKIQPEEGIYFRINTKEPSSENKITTVSMDYCQSCYIAYRSPEAYERLLSDIINGDSTLFTRWDEVENAWKIIEKLISSIEDKGALIKTYKKNSEGPEAALTLLEKTGRKWWGLEELSKGYFTVLGGDQ